jgi:hypothetical protein
MPEGCVNCGRAVYARGRCAACLSYLYRHGVERPEDLCVRAASRRLERELMRRVWGPLMRWIEDREGAA